MSDQIGPRYLYIRILEACNANCFMCGFALSTDSFRLGAPDLRLICSEARSLGIEVVRFTGGEPLLHPDIIDLVRIVSEAGLQCSLITNGSRLAEMSSSLRNSHLSQIIVSLDSGHADFHDRIRRTPRLFDLAWAGLERMRDLGVRTRVNTVVGPHNFRDMPHMKRRLGEAGIDQWELSALKLNQQTRYRDSASVLAVGQEVFDQSHKLVPMGIPWYGINLEQQIRYFQHGIPPRPNEPACHMVDDVIYLDAKNGLKFACNYLPHRPPAVRESEVRLTVHGRDTLIDTGLREQRSYFRQHGPSECTGCSATAAWLSNSIAAGTPRKAWDY